MLIMNETKMKVVFIRHGFAEHNRAFLNEGEDAYFSNVYRLSHLTKLGIEQVQNAEIPPCDLVFSSPLIRCIETSRILVGDEKLIYLCDGLIETQGPYPCNAREQKERITLKYNNVDTMMIAEDYKMAETHESMEDLKKRAQETMDFIVAFAKTKNAESILIVTHNDWLKSLFGHNFKNAEVLITESE